MIQYIAKLGLILQALALISMAAYGADSNPKTIKERVEQSIQKLDKRKFSINFENTSLKDAYSLFSSQLGLRLDLPEDIKGTVSYSFSNVTLKSALEQISEEKDLNFQITKDGYLSISKGWRGSGSGRSIASNVGNSQAKVIYLNYLTATEAKAKISPLLESTDKVIVDGPTNSLAYFGSASNFNNIQAAISLFDKMPPQILIEANVVEINRNKAREYGFSYGDLGDPSLASVESSSAAINNPQPAKANFAVQLGLGRIDGSVLSARLAAAESEGVAKILSNPKIVTINNVAATINSGITYTVKTLAAAGAADSNSTVSGGITQVSAGLTLSVRPTIVGGTKIKLNVNVTNSEPDESTSVDGIPGIINNSTTTEIIVKSGNTATVAGLIKNTKANSESGVPFLSKIPLIGWFFKSETKSIRDKELMIFITPTIIRDSLSGDYMSSSKEMRRHLSPKKSGEKPIPKDRDQALKYDKKMEAF